MMRIIVTITRLAGKGHRCPADKSSSDVDLRLHQPFHKADLAPPARLFGISSSHAAG